jgi:site-specific recombinase XerD
LAAYGASPWLSGLRLHDLRHGQATSFIAAGVDLKTISSRLGGFSTSFTLDHYAHALQSSTTTRPDESATCSRAT